MYRVQIIFKNINETVGKELGLCPFIIDDVVESPWIDKDVKTLFVVKNNKEKFAFPLENILSVYSRTVDK